METNTHVHRQPRQIVTLRRRPHARPEDMVDRVLHTQVRMRARDHHHAVQLVEVRALILLALDAERLTVRVDDDVWSRRGRDCG
jgi:hypothetical protein